MPSMHPFPDVACIFAQRTMFLRQVLPSIVHLVLVSLNIHFYIAFFFHANVTFGFGTDLLDSTLLLLLIFLENFALIMIYAHSSQARVFKPRATGKNPQYLVDPIFSRCNFEGAHTYPFCMIVPKTPLISNILLKRF